MQVRRGGTGLETFDGIRQEWVHVAYSDEIPRLLDFLAEEFPVEVTGATGGQPHE